MSNGFDIAYIALLAIFFLHGWFKGLLHSAVGPLCLVFWVVIGIMNYDLNENIVTAITVTLVGSFITSVIIYIILFFSRQTVQKQHRHYVFWGSRILGAGLSTGWNGLLTAYLAIIIALLPVNFLGLSPIQTSIETSVSYAKFYRYLISPFPTIKNVLITISVFKYYQTLHRFSDTVEYQRVFSNPKIQSIIHDPGLMEKFYSKDALALIQNGRVQEVLRDEQLITDISELGKRIYADRSQQQ